MLQDAAGSCGPDVTEFGVPMEPEVDAGFLSQPCEDTTPRPYREGQSNDSERVRIDRPRRIDWPAPGFEVRASCDG
jgi:hypothetical protein